MAASTSGSTGRIFISYRRDETAYPAGWLFDRLAQHFGAAQIFKDVDSIQLGDDFAQVITRAVGSCDVLLALIGDQWLTITDAHGRRRLDDPKDFVRLEIEAALARNIRVIPILVDGARTPPAEELPDSLATLARRQALELHPARFDFDIGRLLKVLDEAMAEIGAARPSSAAIPRLSGARVASPPATAPRRPRRSTQRRLLAGIGIAVVLVLLTVGVLANRGTTPSATGTASPSTLAAAATTSAPAGTASAPAAGATTSAPAGTSAASAPGATATTSPQPDESSLFRDDFSGQAARWEGAGVAAEGTGYTGGTYHISAPAAPGDGGARSVPMKASHVWPSAPTHVRISVDGFRLPQSDQSMGYGIVCRSNFKGDKAYVLTIFDEHAEIYRWGNGRYFGLGGVYIHMDLNSINELQAVCTSDKERPVVHLELWANGGMIVDADDLEPLPNGGVGLVVMTHETMEASIAEFDNFVVEQLA